jgi:ParB-like chromosome segregation protein Spo0J
MTATNTISHRTTPLNKLWLEAKGWINPREFTGMGADEIAELGASIKEKGMVDAPKVAQLRNTVTEELIDLVVDGQRRILGARDALPKSAPIPVVDLTETPLDYDPDKGLNDDQVDWLLIRAFTTLEREDLSSYELVQQAMRWKSRGKTGEWIAKHIHRSPSWVSKMLKAREAASDKLVLQWRKGEITDEQFKDLAEVKDPEKQAEKTKAVVEARKSGDKAEARMVAKETKETERQTNGHNKSKPTKAAKPAVPTAVKGGQMTLDGREEVPPAKPEPKRTAPNKIVLQELVDVAAKRPPTADYVKGLVDGVKYALGLMEPADFSKAWRQYVSRIQGDASSKKPAAKAKAKAKAPKKKTAAKAKRPAKKTGKKR